MATTNTFVDKPISNVFSISNAQATQITTGTITTITYVKLGIVKFTSSTDVSSVTAGMFMTITGAGLSANNNTFYILYKTGNDLYVRHEVQALDRHILTPNTAYNESAITATATYFNCADVTLVTGATNGSLIEQINIIGTNLNQCPILFFNNSKPICLVILEPFEGMVKKPYSVLMIQGNEYSEPMFDYIQTGQGGLLIKPTLTLTAKAYVTTLESLNIQIIGNDF